MDTIDVLPAIVYGPGRDGFAVLGSSARLLDGDRRAFLDFAKAVSWRPAKIDAKSEVALAVVPSPNGIIVCRLSECEADAYGRNLAMRVEGVLCGRQDNSWHWLTDPLAWPQCSIVEPFELELPVSTKLHQHPSVQWNPATGMPLILASRELVNAPARWFIL